MVLGPAGRARLVVDARPDRLVLAAGRDGLADAEDLAEHLSESEEEDNDDNDESDRPEDESSGEEEAPLEEGDGSDGD